MELTEADAAIKTFLAAQIETNLPWALPLWTALWTDTVARIEFLEKRLAEECESVETLNVLLSFHERDTPAYIGDQSEGSSASPRRKFTVGQGVVVRKFLGWDDGVIGRYEGTVEALLADSPDFPDARILYLVWVGCLGSRRVAEECEMDFLVQPDALVNFDKAESLRSEIEEDLRPATPEESSEVQSDPHNPKHFEPNDRVRVVREVISRDTRATTPAGSLGIVKSLQPDGVRVRVVIDGQTASGRAFDPDDLELIDSETSPVLPLIGSRVQLKNRTETVDRRSCFDAGWYGTVRETNFVDGAFQAFVINEASGMGFWFWAKDIEAAND